MSCPQGCSCISCYMGNPEDNPEVNKADGKCMDCGVPFVDFLRFPNITTHDGVDRCESCEKCYSSDCPICLERVPPLEKNSCITECGHVFHLECLMRHKELNNSSCPMCRDPLEKEQHEEIYCGWRWNRPSYPMSIQHSEARVRTEALDEGYGRGLAEGVGKSLDDLIRMGELRYMDSPGTYEVLDVAANQGSDELTPEEITEQETMRDHEILVESEMMQMCEDMTGGTDLPRFVMDTVAELRAAQIELEAMAARSHNNEQMAFDNGAIRGRKSANEELGILRASMEALERQVEVSNKEIKLLREQLARANT